MKKKERHIERFSANRKNHKCLGCAVGFVFMDFFYCELSFFALARKPNFVECLFFFNSVNHHLRHLTNHARQRVLKWIKEVVFRTCRAGCIVRAVCKLD